MATTYVEKKRHKFKLDAPPPRASRRAVEVASIEVKDPEGRLIAGKVFDPPEVIPVNEIIEFSHAVTENDVLRLEAPLRQRRRRKKGLDGAREEMPPIAPGVRA